MAETASSGGVRFGGQVVCVVGWQSLGVLPMQEVYGLGCAPRHQLLVPLMGTADLEGVATLDRLCRGCGLTLREHEGILMSQGTSPSPGEQSP